LRLTGNPPSLEYRILPIPVPVFKFQSNAPIKSSPQAIANERYHRKTPAIRREEVGGKIINSGKNKNEEGKRETKNLYYTEAK